MPARLACCHTLRSLTRGRTVPFLMSWSSVSARRCERVVRRSMPLAAVVAAWTVVPVAHAVDWSAPTVVSPVDRFSWYGRDAAANPHGDEGVVWTSMSQNLTGRRRLSGGGWSAAVSLNDTADGDPQVAMDRAGDL